MSSLNHRVLPTCLTDQKAGCMLSEGNVQMKLPHVIKCVQIQSSELKIPKQPVIPLGSALAVYMCTLIVLLLVMVPLQDWD